MYLNKLLPTIGMDVVSNGRRKLVYIFWLLNLSEPHQIHVNKTMH